MEYDCVWSHWKDVLVCLARSNTIDVCYKKHSCEMLILTAFLLCETTLQHDVLSRSKKLNSLLWSAGGVHHIHKPTANTYCLRVVAQLCVYCNQIETWFRSEYHSNSTGGIRSHQPYSGTLTMDALSLCGMMSSVDTLTVHQPLWE